MIPSYKPSLCEGCSLLTSGKGFVVGCGDPRSAKIAIVLESPYLEEVNFSVWPPPGPKKRYVLGEVRESQAEMKRRRDRYPEIEPKLLSRGVPVVGRTGFLFNQMLEAAGIQRDLIFVDNAVRCIPAKAKGGANWPVGNAKHVALSMCRQYDRLDEFKPTVVVFSIHPSAVLRETTPYLLIVEDLRKVKEFADAGERVLLLMGGNAVDTYFGFFKNVTKSRGHYEFVDTDWLTKRMEYLKVKAEKARRAAVPKSERIKKPTKAEMARAELAGKIVELLHGDIVTNHLLPVETIGQMWSEPETSERWKRIVVAALTPPPRPKKPAPDTNITCEVVIEPQTLSESTDV